jgi:hypothetical protein
MRFIPKRRYPALRFARACALAAAGALLAACAGCMPDKRAEGPGLRVWIADERADIGPDTAPNVENAVYSAAAESVTLDVARGETVGALVVLNARSGPAGPFVIEVGEFTGAGRTMPANAIVRLHRVEYVRVEDFASWYPEHTGRPTRPTDFADVLVPAEGGAALSGLTLSGTRNQIVYLELNAPPDASAGDYRSTLRVRGLGALPVYQADIRLRVHDVTLPVSPALAVVAACDPRATLVREVRWPDESGPARIDPALPEHAQAIAFLRQSLAELQRHRLNPVLFAGFPRYEDTNDGDVEIDWSSFDALVTPFVSGSAYADGRGARLWPVPVSADYPDPARYGGFGSARYARVLARYLAACERHFRERGWEQRAFARVMQPSALSEALSKQLARLGAIVKQSEVDVPFVAHAPPGSLRGLGWFEAPAELSDAADVWVAPAMWLDPSAAAEQQALGRRVWLMPDAPPYSGSLDVGTRATDPVVIPWLAARYGLDGVWIEDALGAEDAKTRSRRRAGDPAGAGLLYSGAAYGRPGQMLPSMRLKRLRRGIQDYDLLSLLRARNKPLLAKTIAGQLVKWGLTEAALENLLSKKEAGWPADGEAFRVARRLILQELGATFAGPAPLKPRGDGAGAAAGDADGSSAAPEDLADWGRLLNPDENVHPGVRGVRLVQGEDGLEAVIFCGVLNASTRPLTGVWSLPNPPPGWRLEKVAPVDVPPGARKLSTLTLQVDSFNFNADGAYPFELLFEPRGHDAGESHAAPARLAIVAAPLVERPPEIDGQLDDWQLASNNAAGDFRLVRPTRASAPRPVAGTHAFFAVDAENLYVAVRCARAPGAPLKFRSDNEIPIDRGIPWGQDVVEVLLDPRGVAEGSSGDLYVLQVKPNGLLVARKGAKTEPPMGPSSPWLSNARVATAVSDDAWSVELAIPLASFGPAAATTNVWGANVTRLDAHHGEYSSWSGAQSTCYLPLSLGNLVLLRP